MSKEDLKIMRRHYIRVALRMRELKKTCLGSTVYFQDAKTDYLRIARDMRNFWPSILGDK